VSESTLHPNLARLAAAYDQILDQMAAGQLKPAEARARIHQLEARDDEGIRWSIDPDSGEWVRKTAMGDLEYDDNPPTHGVRTPDAFDYTLDPQAYNPNSQLQFTTVDEGLNTAPLGLAGATRSLKPAGSPGTAGRLAALPARFAQLPQRTKVIGTAALVLVMALGFNACSDDAPEDTPLPPANTEQIAPADPADAGNSDQKKADANKEQKAKDKKKDGGKD
jgi:hypothetical protein